MRVHVQRSAVQRICTYYACVTGGSQAGGRAFACLFLYYYYYAGISAVRHTLRMRCDAMGIPLLISNHMRTWGEEGCAGR